LAVEWAALAMIGLTRSESPIRFIVVDTDKRPVHGVVDSLTAPESFSRLDSEDGRQKNRRIDATAR
jgi:hypothetical protein